MKPKSLKKKIRRLEKRLQEGQQRLAKLKQKLHTEESARALKAARKSAARAAKKSAKPGKKKPTGATKPKKKLNLSPERRAQLAAAIGNAKAFLIVRKEFGSFDAYLWQFVGGNPIQNRWRRMANVPARTTESDAMSRDLQRRGFKFVGSTICYALMQAVGMVNDHLITCPRHKEVALGSDCSHRPRGRSIKRRK